MMASLEPYIALRSAPLPVSEPAGDELLEAVG